MTENSRHNWEDLGLYYKYIKDINKYPLLTKEREKLLLNRVQSGNQAAVKELVCSNLKFVINVAFKYRGQGFTLTELINEGNIGLIEAAKRFDTNRKIRFISYAVWWIRQSITRAISEKSRIVRISAEKELVLRRINKHSVKMKFTVGGGLRIDASDLGHKMGYDAKKMEKILEMGQMHTSLDQPVCGEADKTVIDTFADQKAESPEHTAILSSRNRLLEQNLQRLSPQEKKVIRMYFGLDSDNRLSLKDISEVIGLSKERVRQIKESGLENLRRFELPRDLLLAA